MGFNCLNVTEPLPGDSSLFTNKKFWYSFDWYWKDERCLSLGWVDLGLVNRGTQLLSCYCNIHIIGNMLHHHRAVMKRSKMGEGGWGHRISRGINKERACEKCRGQLKKKCNFQVCSRKTCGFSMGLGFWPWFFQGVPSHNFTEFP